MGNHQSDSGVVWYITVSELLASLSSQIVMCPYTHDSVTSSDSLKVRSTAAGTMGTHFSPRTPKTGLAIHMTPLNLNFFTCQMKILNALPWEPLCSVGKMINCLSLIKKQYECTSKN